MTAIVTNKLRVHNAKQFVGGFDGTDVTPIYGFIGRPTPWIANESPQVGGASDTGNPGFPYDTRAYESKTMQYMLHMKRIAAGNVTHACKNLKWSSGVYFNPYRHDYDGSKTVNQLVSGTFQPSTLADANYYCTSQNKVYICLKPGQASSIVDPAETCGTSKEPAKGVDGYLWKYISSRSVDDATMLSTPDYFPVRTVSNTLVPGDELYYQSQAQVNSIPGAIYAVLIESGAGSNWGTTEIPRAVQSGKVRVIGDGTLNTNANGATNGFEIKLIISSGTIMDIEVVDPGQGFTFCTIVNTDIGGILPNITPIITPKTGLGRDPILDLNAYYVVMGIDLAGNVGGKFTTDNDFRQFGIISSPLQFNTSNVLTETTVDCTTTIVWDSAITANPDTVITLSTNRKCFVVDKFQFPADHTVIEYRNKYATRVITPKEIDDVAPNAPISIGNTIAGQPDTILGVINSEWNFQTGELLYVENRRPIARYLDQGEDMRVVIEF